PSLRLRPTRRPGDLASCLRSDARAAGEGRWGIADPLPTRPPVRDDPPTRPYGTGAGSRETLRWQWTCAIAQLVANRCQTPQVAIVSDPCPGDTWAVRGCEEMVMWRSRSRKGGSAGINRPETT